ncbi:MAG: DUF748 domain-containing protein [Nitrospirae bacterium]|nr:DUF748 domain-containing protein [Nitrospirota bacterium]
MSASLILNDSGMLQASGGIGIEPLFANIDLDLKNIAIAPFEPYFSDKLRIEITDGGISSKGALSISKDEQEKIRAVFKGDASINNFSSIDKINSDDFLKWKSLYFGGIDLNTSPMDITIDQIALTDFYSRLIVNADGSLNVQGIVAKQSDNKTAGNDNVSLASDKSAAPDNASAAQSKKMVKINSLSLQGGTVNFSDRHIKPNYTVNLSEIGGRVSGLSSDDTTLADVDLQGKLENYAPLEIKGKINPLKEDLFVDLKVDFKNMELSPLTPYSGKFIGYSIEKGKLSLDLKYLIVKKKIDSQNNVFLDQFTLGDSIESPTATKLPVRLAIALLKNRKGEIDLSLPVTGSLDDPKFSIWGIVGKILLNILVKAATSPFALLGAIFGGGDELSHLDFEYGSFDINPEGEKKLSSIIKALIDRPSLKLEIEGHADIERDTEGLRQNIFKRKLKAQKHKELLKKGAAPASVDSVKIEKEEHLKYLTMAYKEDKFPKPRNMVGLLKDLPASEMEKLMFTHIVVKEDDLRFLAAQRALKVKEHLAKSKQVEQERVFLVEPKTIQPEKKEKLKDSRVDFRLK